MDEAMMNKRNTDDSGPDDSVYFGMHVTTTILSTIGTVILLLVIFCNKERRQNYTNWIVLSALVYLFLMNVTLGPVVARYLYVHRITYSSCYFTLFMNNFPLIPLSIVAIALDKVLVKLHGERYSRKKAVIGFIVASWVLSIVISLFIQQFGYQTRVFTAQSGYQHCYVQPHGKHVAYLIFFLLYLPLEVTMFVLACILMPCCCKQTSSGKPKEEGNVKNAAILVGVTVLFYIVMTTPVEKLGLLGWIFYGLWQSKHIVHIYMTTLFLRQGFQAVLPFLWMVLLPDVRVALCKACCKHSSDEEKVRLVANQENK